MYPLCMTNYEPVFISSTSGGFHKWRDPQYALFLMDTPMEMDDLGVPLFQETFISIFAGS